MKRYKYIGGLVLFVSVLGLLLLFIKRYYISRTVSIIGGADGPTAIFIAGRSGNFIPLYIIAGILLFIIITLLLYRNK